MLEQHGHECQQINVDRVKGLLDGEEMYALSHMYLAWAHARTHLGLDQRGRLLSLAREWRTAADICGGDWQATELNDPAQLLKFMAGLATENAALAAGSGDPFEPSFPEVDVFLAILAANSAEILQESDDPALLRAELLRQAESGGYWHPMNGIRHQTPELFVQDLLEDNPSAALWAREARWWVLPDAIQEEHQLLDALDPVPFGCNSI